MAASPFGPRSAAPEDNGADRMCVPRASAAQVLGQFPGGTVENGEDRSVFLIWDLPITKRTDDHSAGADGSGVALNSRDPFVCFRKKHFRKISVSFSPYISLMCALSRHSRNLVHVEF